MLFRSALLIKYGGIWIDSTVFISEKGIPPYILNSSLFMFKIDRTLDNGYNDSRMYASWFIKASPGNELLKVIYEILKLYWKQEMQHPYFLFHYILRLVVEANQELVENLPMIIKSPSNILYGKLNERFDDEYYNILCNERSIQKLNYRIIPKHCKDTYYSVLCDRYLR